MMQHSGLGTIGRRAILAAGAGLTTVTAGPARAQAPAFPSRPVRLVVSFAPGGSSDLLARLVGAELQRRLGQPVVVENRAGAGGTLGMAQVSRADPDGYTIVQGTAGTIALTPTLMNPPPYDATTAFTPLGFVASDANGVFINPSIPARNMDELVAWIRAQPNPVPYASSGAGTPGHIGMALFAEARDLRMLHVPYRGAAPAATDVAAGNAAMVFTSMIVGRALTDAGRLRLLSIGARERLPEYRNVPTLREAGLAEMEVPIWYGYFAPPATPRPIVERYHAAIADMLRDPSFIAKLREQMMEPFPADQGLAAAPTLVSDTVAQVKRMIEITGVRIE